LLIFSIFALLFEFIFEIFYVFLDFFQAF